ncbi:hypothetical protein [Aeribacillus composti]|uniref:hypothetical protein n=1 Tax=Aeribacillus composti TaxID=1868734 RepID=UPI003D23508F
MNDKDQLWKLKRYYEKALSDYYSTDEIDPDMANRIVGGLTRFMNITEQQQHEIERLKKFLSWEQEEAHGLDKEVTFQLEQLKQAQAKAERYEKALKGIKNDIETDYTQEEIALGEMTSLLTVIYEQARQALGGSE